MQLQNATKEDKILSKVVSYVYTGNWPNEKNLTQNINPYYNKINKFSLHDATSDDILLLQRDV